MTKRRVSDLEGYELDYWVGRANGFSTRELSIEQDNSKPQGTKHVVVYGVDLPSVHYHCGARGHGAKSWHPSTNWSQGGPLIEKLRLGVVPKNDEDVWICGVREKPVCHRNKSFLVAAMRSFVELVLGNEVDDVR
jgi:hypothetical protein